MDENKVYEMHEEEDHLDTFKDQVTESKPKTEEDLRNAIEEQMSKIRRQSMLIGAQTMCSVVLEKIMVAHSKPGKMSMNDYKRLVKDIEQFCRTGLSRKVNADGETEPVNEESADAETVQN